MDKKRGVANVSVSIVFRVLLLVASILVRRYIIKFVGNEINGLNSLYISILDFLSVAELGIGGAITFCMYKPIVEGDNDKVAALYGLFTKLYLIIGGIILVGGCAIMPALPYLAKDYQTVDVNLYLTFGLMLASVVLSYVFSSKTSLINAYKNNYITTTISSIGMLLQCGMQIAVLVCTQSFVWFLVCRIIAIVLQWATTEIFARVRYKDILGNKQKIDADTKKEVTKSIKAMFMHKIGGILVNTADSLIISAFIGISILGKYSNYTTIVVSMTSVLTLCFSPLTSVIGHMCVEEDGNTIKKYYTFFHTFNFILGVVFFLGYYAIANDLIAIFFETDGADLQLAHSVIFVVTVNYFIQFMRQAANLFRDATGTFYNDRWKPLVEGTVNVGLSILFVFIFPQEYNVVGVIVATIITNLFICDIVEPYVLYKHAFHASPKRYYIRNYVYMAGFCVALVALHFSLQSFDNRWIDLLVNGCIAVGIAVIPCAIAVLVNKDFRHYMGATWNRLKKRLHRTSQEVVEAVGTETPASDVAHMDAAGGEENPSDMQNSQE